MKLYDAMNRLHSFCSSWALALLALGLNTFAMAQSAVLTTVPQPDTAIQKQDPTSGITQLQTNQSLPSTKAEVANLHRAFAEDFSKFLAAHSGDSPAALQQAIEKFRKNNARRAATIFQKMQVATETEPRGLVPFISQIEIPEEASPTLEEILVQHAQLANQLALTLNVTAEASTEERNASVQECSDKTQTILATVSSLINAYVLEEQQKLLPMPPSIQIPVPLPAKDREILRQRQIAFQAFIESENQIRQLPLEQQANARRAAITDASSMNVSDPLGSVRVPVSK